MADLEEKRNDEVQENEDDKDASGKSTRGEKKFKKAMLKMGLKPISGINRVTIRKAKNFLLYIDNPEVLVSPGNENSYVVFGEAKMQDFNQNLANAEAGKFKKAEKPVEVQVQDEKANDEEEENEEGVDPATIEMVVDHCKCSRAKAVRALKKNNNDSVNAILELSS